MPLEITARYGLPYVADVHVGVGFEFGASCSALCSLARKELNARRSGESIEIFKALLREITVETPRVREIATDLASGSP